MQSDFPRIMLVLLALSLGSVSSAADAQTREDEAAIREAVETMTRAVNQIIK